MGTVTLIATMAYPYAGRSLQAGDTFEASARDADTLKKIGRAKDAPSKRYTTRALTPDAVEEPKTRRQYRRRDLEAEP